MSNRITATEVKLTALLTDEPWSDELPEEFEVMVSGDWTDAHKSEIKEDIIKHLPTAQFFRVYFSRYGDHWQGYETSYEGLQVVEPRQVTVIEYFEVTA